MNCPDCKPPEVLMAEINEMDKRIISKFAVPFLIAGKTGKPIPQEEANKLRDNLLDDWIKRIQEDGKK